MYVTFAFSLAARAGETQVHLTAPDQFVLNRVTSQLYAQASGVNGSATATGETWETVCRAPCGTLLPTDAYYFVDAQRMPASRWFLLPSDAAEVVVSVDKVGNPRKRTAGMSLAVGGILSILTGGAIALVGGVTDDSGLLAGGGAVAALGGGMAIGGFPLAASGNTLVSVH